MLIVLPDDNPPVIAGTPALNRLRRAAAARRITVTNTPGANAIAVAEHTVALTLALVKQLVPDHGSSGSTGRILLVDLRAMP